VSEGPAVCLEACWGIRVECGAVFWEKQMLRLRVKGLGLRVYGLMRHQHISQMAYPVLPIPFAFNYTQHVESNGIILGMPFQP